MIDSLALPRRYRSRRVNAHLLVGGALLIGFALLGIFGPNIAPYDAFSQDLLATLAPPSPEHWFGADQVGRDIFSRVIVGTRYTLSVALVSVASAAVIGVMMGATAGYFEGWVDRLITGFVDLLLTVPNLVLAIAIASAVGASAFGLTLAITASFVPSVARLVRSRVLELREEDFINAAVTVGMSQWRVLWRHVLPNTFNVIVVETSLLAGQAVLVGSALGFIGLGVQPPAPEWGAMLGGSRDMLEVAPHLVVAPGLAISVLIFAFNTFGDGLRDKLDPRMKQG